MKGTLPMSARLVGRSKMLGVGTVAVSVAVLVASCGRAGSSPQGSSAGTPKPTSSPSASSAQAVGEFGTAKKVCAPGSGTGGSGRGIVGKTIHIGTLSDTGSSVEPGLGQEFFDVADAFAKWCNAAGGINGRTIVVDKLDAKLFEGAARVITACQSDFMLVGGGNALDAPDVKPRLACNLGEIPAYSVSPQASGAGLQVTPEKTALTTYQAGALRLLADAYPATKQGLGIAGSSLASLTNQGLQAQQAYQGLGYKVSTLQPRPALVDNYRPWIEQMKTAGAQSDFEIVASNISPIFNAINDVGWKPNYLLVASTFYSPKSIEAAKAAGAIPPTYTYFYNLPWELASKYPVVAQAKSIVQAASPNALLTNFTALGFNSWVLWAQSATACGDNLTQACVLQKAAAHSDWDAGGLFPPVDTNPSTQKPTNCVLLMRLTATGFVYDAKLNQANQGVYNCDPRNNVPVKNYQAG
jgi:ABC-type branched-subunit amino acid transport system substrate-binding protein